jgi:hypothetical protein
MHHRLMITLAAAIALVLAVAGCGGDDNDDGASASDGGGDSPTITVKTASVSKKEFARRANDLCTKERTGIPQRTEAYQRKAGNLEGEEAYAEGVKAVLLPVFQAEVEKLSKLGAPPQDAERIEAMLIAQQEAIDETKQKSSFKTAEDATAPFDEATKMLREYGLVACLVVPEPY